MRVQKKSSLDSWRDWQWPPKEEEIRQYRLKERRYQRRRAIRYLRENGIWDRLLDLMTGIQIPHTHLNLRFRKQ